MNLRKKLTTICLTTFLSLIAGPSSSIDAAIQNELIRRNHDSFQADTTTPKNNVLIRQRTEGVSLYQYDAKTGKLVKTWDSVNLGGDAFNTISQPFVGDADNDGKNELLGLDNYGLFIWKNAGAMPVAFVELDTGMTGFKGCVITADADGDKKNEILAGWNDQFFIFKYAKGQLKKILQKSYQDSITSIYNIAVDDTDGDGIKEIMLAGSAIQGKEKIFIHRFNGTELQDVDQIIAPTWLTYVLKSKDVNRDGISEIVTTNRDGKARVYAYDKSKNAYQLIWESENIFAKGMDLGDVDNDGLEEIVIGSTIDPEKEQKPRILIFKYDGNAFRELWSSETDINSSWPGISIGDIDNDGVNEFALNGTEIYKHDPTSSKDKPSFKLFNKLEASSNTLFGKIGVFEPSSSVNRDGLYRLFFHSTYTDGGGNNNIIEPGETIKVNVAVKSQWSNAKNVRVRIAQKSGKENLDVKILKDESRIDEIPANSVVSTEKDPFIVKISEGAAINSELYLTVLMSTTEGYSNSMTISSTKDHMPGKPLLGFRKDIAK